MASRPELIQCCNELEIDHKGLTIEEMTEEIKKAADYKFARRKVLYGDSDASVTLLKFLTLEYDYYLVDKNGKKVSYKVVM